MCGGGGRIDALAGVFCFSISENSDTDGMFFGLSVLTVCPWVPGSLSSMPLAMIFSSCNEVSGADGERGWGVGRGEGEAMYFALKLVGKKVALFEFTGTTPSSERV